MVVKGYHECPFSVEVGEQLITQKKKGDLGNALKVINKMRDHGQLGFRSTTLAFKKQNFVNGIFSEQHCLHSYNFFGKAGSLGPATTCTCVDFNLP